MNKLKEFFAKLIEEQGNLVYYVNDRMLGTFKSKIQSNFP